MDLDQNEDKTVNDLRKHEFEERRKQSDEFDQFKAIEKNIKREILDYSSTDESPTLSNHEDDQNSDTAQDNSETVSEDSLLLDSDSEGSQPTKKKHAIPVRKPSHKEMTIGHQIMERKRLRVFQTITKESKSRLPEDLKKMSSEKTGFGLKLTVKPC